MIFERNPRSDEKHLFSKGTVKKRCFLTVFKKILTFREQIVFRPLYNSLRICYTILNNERR